MFRIVLRLLLIAT